MNNLTQKNIEHIPAKEIFEKQQVEHAFIDRNLEKLQNEAKDNKNKIENLDLVKDLEEEENIEHRKNISQKKFINEMKEKSKIENEHLTKSQIKLSKVLLKNSIKFRSQKFIDEMNDLKESGIQETPSSYTIEVNENQNKQEMLVESKAILPVETSRQISKKVHFKINPLLQTHVILKVRTDDEYKFNDFLFSEQIKWSPKLESPINLFAKNCISEKLNPIFGQTTEEILTYFLVLNEFQTMIYKKEKETSQNHILTVVKLFRRKHLKLFIDKITGKTKQIKKINKECEFQHSRSNVILQKLGKISKKVILRPSMLVEDTFAERSKDLKSILKKEFFKNHTVRLESKIGVADIFRDINAKKATKYTPVEWPLKKDKLKDMYYRLTLKEIFSGREKCLYFETFSEANNIKQNAIVKRVLGQDMEVNEKMNNLFRLFTVQMAERFYEYKLKKFMIIENFNKIQIEENKIISEALHEYFVLFFPNLVPTSIEKKSEVLKPQNSESLSPSPFSKKGALKVQFRENSTVFEFNQKQEQQIINNKSVEKKPHLTFSQFDVVTNIENNIQIPQKLVHSNLNDSHIDYNYNLLNPFGTSLSDFLVKLNNDSQKRHKNRRIKQIILQNSKAFLFLHQMILSNFGKNDQNVHTHLFHDKLTFSISIRQQSSKRSKSWIGFRNQKTENYTSFSFNNFLTLEEKNSIINVQIINQVDSRVLFDGPVDILENFESISPNSPSHSKISILLKNLNVECLLFFRIVFVPENLETSYLILKNEVISKNLNKFSELNKSVNDFASCLQYLKLIDHQTRFPVLSKLKIEVNEKKETNFLTKLRDIQYDNFKLSTFLETKENKILSQLLKHDPLTVKLKTLLEQLSMSDFQREAIDPNKVDFSLQSIIEGISPNIRYSLSRFLIKDDLFFSQEMLKESFVYKDSEIQVLEQIIQNKTQKMSFCEKFTIRNMCFKIYLKYLVKMAMQLQGKLITSFLLRLIVNIVIKTYLNNKHKLDELQVEVIASQIILSSMNFEQHRIPGMNMNIQTVVIFFKILMRCGFQKEYSVLSKFNSNFDINFINMLSNSFVDVLDLNEFAMYNDFKMIIAAYIKEHKEDDLAKQINATELGISALIDVLFLTKVIIKHHIFLSSLENPQKMIDSIKGLIKNESINFKQIFSETIVLLLSLSEVNFYLNNFIYVKKVAGEKSIEKIKLLLELKPIFEGRQNHVAMMIIQIIETHQDLVHSHQQDSDLTNTLSLKTQNKNGEKNDRQKNFYSTQTSNVKIVNKFDELALFLDNIETSNTQTGYQNTKSIFSANEPIVISQQQLETIFLRNFRLGQAQITNLLPFFRLRWPDQNFPLISILLAILYSASQNQNQMISLGFELINFLNDPQNHKIGKKVAEVNEEAVFLIVNSIADWNLRYNCKLTYRNWIRFTYNNEYNFIKAVKINLEIVIIDVLQHCSEFSSQFFLQTGRFGIHFNHKCCKKLEESIGDILKNLYPDREEKLKFDMYLEYFSNGKILSKSIRFIVNFSPEFIIFCAEKEPIIFSKYEIKFQQEKLETILKDLLDFVPLNSSNVFQNLDLSKKKLKFVFQIKKKPFLISFADFGFNFLSELKYDVANLSYEFSEISSLFEQNPKNMNIKLPILLVWSSLKEVLKFIILKIMSKLDEEECFNLVRIYSQKYQISTNEKKIIHPDCIFESLLLETSPIFSKLEDLSIFVDF